MTELIVYPDTKEKLDAVKNILQAYEIRFEEKIEDNKLISGFDWYEATEELNSIIYSLIAHYDVELMNFKKKEQTQIYKDFCERMIIELQDLKRNSQVWSSITGMRAQIEKYSPLLIKINEAA